jgi:hypothetical protein
MTTIALNPVSRWSRDRAHDATADHTVDWSELTDDRNGVVDRCAINLRPGMRGEICRAGAYSDSQRCILACAPE